MLSIKPKSSFFCCLCNIFLKQVPAKPYLDMLLFEDLERSPHIANITKKENCRLAFIRRNLPPCPTLCKHNAYMALVRQVLKYCASAFLRADADRIE